MTEPEPFEIALDDDVLDDLRRGSLRTLARPARGPRLGVGRGLRLPAGACAHWAREYDWRRSTGRCEPVSNRRWRGDPLASGAAADGGAPAGALDPRVAGRPIESCGSSLASRGGPRPRRPVAAGLRVLRRPGPPLNVAGSRAGCGADGDALGPRALAVQGGDWGSMIAARMAFDAGPSAWRRSYVNAPSGAAGAGETWPIRAGGGRAESPIRDARTLAAARGLPPVGPGAAPDALAVGLADSPAGSRPGWWTSTAGWRDCDGDVERRFSKDELCDFLTLYWATDTIASSMRHLRGRGARPLAAKPGERIAVPAAAADFPGRDHPPAPGVDRARARRPAPLDRVRSRRPLRRLRGAGAAERRSAGLPGRALSGLVAAIIADTHLPRGSRRLPDACVGRIRDADLLIHAGDFDGGGTRSWRRSARSSWECAATSTTRPCQARLPERTMVELEGARMGLSTTPACARRTSRACGRVPRRRRRGLRPLAHAAARARRRPRSSTPAARPSAAARPPARWAWRASGPAASASATSRYRRPGAPARPGPPGRPGRPPRERPGVHAIRGRPGRSRASRPAGRATRAPLGAEISPRCASRAAAA